MLAGHPNNHRCGRKAAAERSQHLALPVVGETQPEEDHVGFPGQRALAALDQVAALVDVGSGAQRHVETSRLEDPELSVTQSAAGVLHQQASRLGASAPPPQPRGPLLHGYLLSTTRSIALLPPLKG
jgi:hypothetical protein